jgi:hypothetical protein
MRRFPLSILVFILALIYYCLQACPTYYFWDSAELTAAVLGGGVPHPPGFPFFLILSNIWSLVMASAGWLNIFAAFFGAVGLGLWFAVLRRLLLKIDLVRDSSIASSISFFLTLVFGFTFSYCIQATRFEVYTLNFSGFALLMFLSLKTSRSYMRPVSWGLLFFIIAGLFMGVHNLTIALALPGLLMIMLHKHNPRPAYIWLGILVSCGICGAFYLTIMHAAASNNPLNWGTPSSIKGLLNYILLKGFETSTSRMTADHFIQQAKFLYDVFTRQLGLAGLALIIPGAYYSMRHYRSTALALLIIFGLNLFSVSLAENYFYANYDLHGYLIISLAVATYFIGVTFLLLFRLLESRLSSTKTLLKYPWAYALTLFAIALIFFIPIYDNFYAADLSRVKMAEDYSRQFLDSAPPRSLVVTTSYNTFFCALALQAKDPTRRNVTVINLYNLDHEWGRAQCDRLTGIKPSGLDSRQKYYQNLINTTANARPIYIEYDRSSSPIAPYLHPQGMGYLLSLTDTTATNPNDSAYVADAFKTPEIECYRTWILWFQNRAEYFSRIKNDTLAYKYLGIVDSLAIKASNL